MEGLKSLQGMARSKCLMEENDLFFLFEIFKVH